MAHEGTAPDGAAPEDSAHHAPGRITRVILKNYKSIVSCDVELQPLTILVGPNGSGKSNFLDALAFVSEALTVGLEQAIRNRGNIDRILSAARPHGDDSFSIELHFQLTAGGPGSYAFEIAWTPDGSLAVQLERIDLYGIQDAFGEHLFWIREYGVTQWTSDDGLELDPLDDDSLFLVHLVSDRRVRPAYDLLTSMKFYNPMPELMRDLKRRDPLPHLRSDGANLASMLARMQESEPDMIWRIEQYMKRVLHDLESIATVNLAGRDLLQISVDSADPQRPYVFDADQLSDGTLRALAVLVALFQGRIGGKSETSLVGIEEPENNLHPATGGAFADALIDASYDGQVLVTTHSTSLLDGEEIPTSSLVVVATESGRTQIGPIDEVSRSILRDHLMTAGELLEQGQLLPAPKLDDEPTAPSAIDPMPVGR